jgi:hypothetical protein
VHVPMGPEPAGVHTVADVVARMERISADLPIGDGVRAFNEMYLATTRNVDEAIRGQQFADPAFMTRLDVVFATLFFSALDVHAGDASLAPHSWRALFEARDRAGISQLQFAVAGMNAHINYDLARAVVLTARDVGGGLDERRRADFLVINDVLERTQPAVQRQLLTGPFALVDSALGSHDDRVAAWGIRRAREFAWATAETLWDVQGSSAEKRFLGGVDRMVGLTSRLLLR